MVEPAAVGARTAAVIWTRERVLALPLSHIAAMGPQYAAALTAAVTPLVALLCRERDRRLGWLS